MAGLLVLLWLVCWSSYGWFAGPLMAGLLVLLRLVCWSSYGWFAGPLMAGLLVLLWLVCWSSYGWLVYSTYFSWFICSRFQFRHNLSFLAGFAINQLIESVCVCVCVCVCERERERKRERERERERFSSNLYLGHTTLILSD